MHVRGTSPNLLMFVLYFSSPGPRLGFLLLLLAFHAGTARAEPTPPTVTVTFLQIALSAVDTVLAVSVQVASPYQVALVEGTVAGHTFPLTAYSSPAGSGFRGTVPLGGLPYGTYPLTVTATDVFGETGTGTADYPHDLPPQLTVHAPSEGSVTSGLLRIRAVCVDDAQGGCSVRARVSCNGCGEIGTETAQDSLDTIVDVSSLDSAELTVRVDATDAYGHNVYYLEIVYMVNNIYLIIERTFEDGQVAALDAGRVLLGQRPFFVSTQGSAWRGLRIFDRTALSYSDVPMPPGEGALQDETFLTDGGIAFLSTSLTNDGAGIYVWQNGSLARVGTSYDYTSVDAAGDYIVWSPETSRLQRHRISTSQSGHIASAVSLGSYRRPTVSAEGSVLFASGGQMRLYRNLQTIGLGLVSTYPVPVFDEEDGYYQTGTSIRRVAVGESASSLVTGTGSLPYFRARFVVANGWVSFERRHPGDLYQVWLYNPDGSERQVSFFSTSSSLEAVSPTGQSLFVHEGTRYLDDGVGLASPVGPALGTGYWDGSGWKVAIGNTLFALSSAPTAGEAPLPLERDALSVGPAFPNPVEGLQARIPFHLPENGPVVLELFDVLGRKVATLASGVWAAGEHHVIWETGSVSSGVYVMRLSAFGETASRQIVVAR